MIIYRPHRGKLDEAMALAKEFQNEEEMKNYIVKEWQESFPNMDLFTADEIVIDEATMNDDRNGWEDTHYVCTKRMGNEDYMEMYGTPQCIGMCATVYPKPD